MVPMEFPNFMTTKMFQFFLTFERSRVDLYLPLNSSVNVMEGQTVIGGETVIGEMKSISNSKK